MAAANSVGGEVRHAFLRRPPRLRGDLRRTLLGAVAVVAAVLWSAGASPAAGAGQGGAAESARRQPAQSRDLAVLEAVLRDVVTRRYAPDDPNSPSFSLAAFGEPPRVLFFDPKPVPYPRRGDALDPIRDRHLWEVMPHAERAAAREAAASGKVRARDASAGGTFARYRPRDARIRLRDAPPVPGEEERIAAKRDFPVFASVPGYTRDGAYAFVRLSFSDLFHPSSGVYLLQRRPGGGAWTVRHRAFTAHW